MLNYYPFASSQLCKTKWDRALNEALLFPQPCRGLKADPVRVFGHPERTKLAAVINFISFIKLGLRPVFYLCLNCRLDLKVLVKDLDCRSD